MLTLSAKLVRELIDHLDEMETDETGLDDLILALDEAQGDVFGTTGKTAAFRITVVG